MAWTDCYFMFLLLGFVVTSLTSVINSYPVPKSDLISGDDFLSILIRGDTNEELYRDITIPSRVSRYRRPYIRENFSSRETPVPLETSFVPYVDAIKTGHYVEKEENDSEKPDFFSTESVLNVVTTTTVSPVTEETTTTDIASTSPSSIVQTTTQATMKVITSVHVSSSVQEEIKIHTKRPKSKQVSKSEEDSMKSDSSHFHAIISAPKIDDNDSEFLYSSIPRSRMQRKQDNASPYQTIIHHDDQGTISFSSLNIPASSKDSSAPKQKGSWWWYGWNYPHLSKKSTTESTESEVTTEVSTTTEEMTSMTSEEDLPPSTTISSQHTSTVKPIILHDLNKIPYDKLNAPLEESQSNDVLSSALGKFVPSCKQQQATVGDEMKINTEFISLDDDKNDADSVDNAESHKNHTDNVTPEHNNYQSSKEEDDAKFGYVVEGRNYRKYRVEEKTSDGFIVGEYGVLSHNDGSLRGVRYTADSNINPRLIHDALMKFLSL